MCRNVKILKICRSNMPVVFGRTVASTLASRHKVILAEYDGILQQGNLNVPSFTCEIKQFSWHIKERIPFPGVGAHTSSNVSN